MVSRQLSKLSARAVATMTAPGRHSDGGGLYLVVDKSGGKRWVFLFRWRGAGSFGAGRLREMGLGGLSSVSLARAREKAAAARALVADRIDPIAAKREPGSPVSFEDVAKDFLATKKSELRSDKSVARIERSLKYAEPLHKMSPADVSVDHVLGVLKPVWSSKPETAQNVRVFVEAVLDAARARGLREGENPARWKGHLDHLLPRRSKLQRGHHRAMAYQEVPAFVARLRLERSLAARALKFLILTAARSGEVLGAQWSEINEEVGVWTVPQARMKGDREHRVPLSNPSLALLGTLSELGTKSFVFPGQRAGRPLSGMAMEMLLRRMGEHERATVHGFRSAFRDWAGDETDFPRELAEAALAHSVGDATERAYRRADALERRRELMAAWASYCG